MYQKIFVVSAKNGSGAGSGSPSLLAEGGLGFLQLGVDQLPQVPDGLDGTKTDERQLLCQSLSVIGLGRFF